MPFLVLSLVALAAGPALGAWLEPRARLRRSVELAVAVALLALLVLHVLPEAFHEASYWILPAALASSLATMGLERLGRLAPGASPLVVAMAFVALGVHSALDGAALSGAHAHGTGRVLAVAVVLHRVPTSLAIWWLGNRHLGRAQTVALLTWDAAATFVGYYAGDVLVLAATPFAIGIAQAVLAGSLLHVALHVRGHAHGGHGAAA